jgi:aspartokinase/homoserine dehydrogenase 1
MKRFTIVHKFGGTSVGSAERFARVAEIVQEHHTHGRSGTLPQTVVVVSAMSGVTNQLIAGARAAVEGQDAGYQQTVRTLLVKHKAVVEDLLVMSAERLSVLDWIQQHLAGLERLYQSIAVLGELTARGQDHVVAFGELLSIHILTAALRACDMQAEALSATHLIVTDDNFGRATPRMDLTRKQLQARIQPLLAKGVIPVITGFIAATESGVTTTLGRGGSDYTAAIVGAGLDADEVWIWSDVDGILTADPNLVAGARTLRELSYAEAAELAYYGANVLHPKTIRPVINHNIPLRILNSFNPLDPGTLIVKTPSATRVRLPAIISTTGLSLIAIGSQDDSWSLHSVAEALQCLSDARLEVLMFSQSFSEHNLNLVVQEQDQAQCLKALQSAFDNHLQRGDWALATKEKVATVSVVGTPGWNETGTVSHAFAVLGKLGTRVIAVAQAASEHSVSFCIPQEQVVNTVLSLHQALGLENPHA